MGVTHDYSISTGCIASLLRDQDPKSLASIVEALAAPGLEVLLLSRWSERIDQMATLFKQVEAPVHSVHGDKRIGGCFGHSDPDERTRGIENFKLAVNFASKVGAPYLNIHLWDLPDSDDNLDRNIQTFEGVSSYARDHGVRTLIEIVPCRRNSPLENMERVVDALGDDAAFTIDFEFLSWSRPIEEQIGEIGRRFGSRILNLHVRDFDGAPFSAEGRRRYVRPGQGRIPYSTVVKALENSAVSRVVTLEAAYREPDWTDLIRSDLNFVRGHFE